MLCSVFVGAEYVENKVGNMVILVVIPSLTSYLFLREFCGELAAKGWEVHLATSWRSLGNYEEDQSRVTFHSIDFPRGMNPISHLKSARKLNNIVKDIKPDVVDVHFSAAAFTAALARRSHWPPTIATVQGLRFPLATGFQAKLLKFAECWSAKKLDNFIVLTQDDYDALKREGVERCALQGGYGFGCDLEKFDENNVSTADKERTKKEIGKGEGDVVFVFIGRLVAFKGFHLVVKAFLQVQSSNKNIKLLVCGEFDDLHPSGLTDDELSEFNKNENIISTGWTDRIERYLSVSDVVVFPSEREGVPVNLMEALSMGVPVITCDSRGCREVMNEGKNGIVLESRTVDAVAAAMLSMSTDEGLRNRYSRDALGFRGNFTRSHFVQEHISAVTGLSHSSGKSAQ